MRVDVRIWRRDYTGTEGSTGALLLDASTFAQVDAFVLALDSVLDGLSDAASHKALAYIKFASTQLAPALPGARVRQNLTVLLANSTRYASFNIPAPRPLAYETSGPYSGFKVDMQAAGQEALFRALADALAPTVTPAGEPFPTARFMALLRRPPL